MIPNFSRLETNKLLGALQTSSVFHNASAHLIHDLLPFVERRSVKAGAALELSEPGLVVVLRGGLEERDEAGRLEREIRAGQLVGEKALLHGVGLTGKLQSPRGAEVVVLFPSALSKLPRHLRHDLGLKTQQEPPPLDPLDDEFDFRAPLVRTSIDQMDTEATWEWVFVSVGPGAGAAPVEGLTRALAETITEDFQEAAVAVTRVGAKWQVVGRDRTVDHLKDLKSFEDERPYYVLVALGSSANPLKHEEAAALDGMHIILTGSGPEADLELSHEDRNQVLRTIVLNRQDPQKINRRLYLAPVTSMRARECRIELEREDLTRLLRAKDRSKEGLSPYAKESLSRWARFVTRRSVGVALGGGGAWGYFHVALLQKLRQAGVPIDLTSGTSFGSLVSVYYAAKGLEGLDLLIERGPRFSVTQYFSMFTTRVLERQISGDLDDADLSRLPIASNPFTTNLTHRRGETGMAGPVGLGARASSSAPGVFAPTVLSQTGVFVDGVVTGNVPYEVLIDQGADLLVASNAVPQPVSRNVPRSRAGRLVAALNPLNRITDTFRSALLALYEMGTEPPHFSQVFVQANLTIEEIQPAVTPSDFGRAKEIVEASWQSDDLLIQVEEVVSRWRERKKPREF